MLEAKNKIAFTHTVFHLSWQKVMLLLTRVLNGWKDQYRILCILNKYMCEYSLYSHTHNKLTRFGKSQTYAIFMFSAFFFQFHSMECVLICAWVDFCVLAKEQNHCMYKELVNESWFHCKTFAHHKAIDTSHRTHLPFLWCRPIIALLNSMCNTLMNKITTWWFNVIKSNISNYEKME